MKQGLFWRRSFLALIGLALGIAGLTVCSYGSTHYPIITEFQAVNDGTILSGDGDDPDWIEIYNPNTHAISLQGYSLQDSKTTWIFPNVHLEASTYLVVFASGQNLPIYVNGEGYLHTTFKLSSAGETLRLICPDGQTDPKSVRNPGTSMSKHLSRLSRDFFTGIP